MKMHGTILCGLLFICNGFAAAETDYPLWFVNPPQPEGKLVALGTGTGGPEALTRALGQLSQLLEMKVQSLHEEFSSGYADGDSTTLLESDAFPTSSTKSISSKRIGAVKIRALDKSFIEDGADGHSELYESAIEVTYTSPADTTQEIQMRSWEQLIIAGQDTTESETFESVSTNNDLRSLIAELEKNGVELESSGNENFDHFIMLIYAPE